MATPPALALLDPWLQDPAISEIMINGPKSCWVERGGRMELVQSPFHSAHQIQNMIDSLLSATGRSVTMKQPFVDFRLPDGSRVNVVIPPVALDGPVVTIRKFSRAIGTMEDLVRLGTLTERMAYLLYAAVRGHLNVLFSGGAGTGKTTTLAMASGYIDDSERIVVIEDTAELDLKQGHVVRLECRPPNMEGSGAIKQSELLRNSLRMRPSRIIVGEVRGDEAIEMLQAMTSGHDGCLAVLHASSPLHAVSRLEMMVLSRGLPLPLWGIQRQISTAVDLIVQMAIHRDGTRRVTHITEVGGVAGEQVELQDLYTFDDDGTDAQGRVQGRFRCSGHRPAFVDRFRELGPDVVDHMFTEGAD